MSLKIVISCNKKDFFLTKILVGSIRFYYQNIEIFLIKDFSNGVFNTKEMESVYKVKILDLGIKNYGWAAGKMHFLLSKEFDGEKYLMLDSDIVLIGRLLEKLEEASKDYEIGVSAEVYDNPYDKFVEKTYYSYSYLKTYNPGFEFPGYLFNTGQMIVTPGILNQQEMYDFFDLSSYPYYKKLEQLPLVDQSILNYILPLKEQKGEIRIYKGNYMIWSESKEALTLDIEKIKEGIEYPFLIHWAGAVRVPMLDMMTRFDILNFFEKYYYQRVPFGNMKRKMSKIYPSINYSIRKFYRQIIKPVIFQTFLKIKIFKKGR